MDNNVHVPFLQDREDALLQGTDSSYVRKTIQNNNNTLTRRQDHEDALQNASECFKLLWNAFKMLQNASNCFKMLQNASTSLNMLENASEELRRAELVSPVAGCCGRDLHAVRLGDRDRQEDDAGRARTLYFGV